MEGASDLQSFVVTVLSTNDAPKIVSVPETTGVQDTGYGYTIEAVDLDPGDVLTYALVSGPDGMTVAATTGVLAWTPTSDQLGLSVVHVRVTDVSGATDNQTFAIQVLDSLPPEAAFTVAQGGSVSYSEYGGRVVSVSSQNGANTVLSGAAANGYRSDLRQTQNQYMVIELASPDALIDRVSLTGDASKRGVDGFELSVSDTVGGPFVSVLTANLPMDAVAHELEFQPVRARFVRLDLRSNHGASDYLTLKHVDVRGRPKQGGVVSLLEGGASIVRQTAGNAALAIGHERRNSARSAWLPGAPAPQSFVVDLSGDVRTIDRMRVKNRVTGQGPRTVEVRASTGGSGPGDFNVVASVALANTTVEQWVDLPRFDARYLEVAVLDSYGTNVELDDVRFSSSGVGGPAVAFDDTSRDPDGSVVSWSWSFGDGETSGAQHPTHLYAAPGSYRVRLEVTDDSGLVSFTEQTYVVEESPKAGFVWTPGAPVEGDLVSFTVHPLASDLLEAKWTVTDPDGHPRVLDETLPTEVASSHLELDGTWQVELQLTNTQLVSSTVKLPVEVRAGAPVADAGRDYQVYWGQAITESYLEPDYPRITDPSQVQLSPYSPGVIIADEMTCTWDFGDGETRSSPCLRSAWWPSGGKVYADPGSYVATLTVRDEDGLTSSDSMEVTVRKRPVLLAVGKAESADGSGNVDVLVQLGDAFGASTGMLGKVVEVTRGTVTENATIDARGQGRVRLPFETGQRNLVEASFAGDSHYEAGHAAAVFEATPLGEVPLLVGPPTETGNRGTSFVVAFDTAGNDKTLLLTAAAPTVVSVASGDEVQATTVVPGTVTQIDVPGSEREVAPSGVIARRGLEITAASDVHVYGLDSRAWSVDGFLGLAETGLGTDHVVPTYVGSGWVHVVATEDNTHVTIVPAVAAKAGRDTPSSLPARTPFSVVLDRRESLYLSPQRVGTLGPDTDLTGTTVTSDRPVSVFGGHTCVGLPDGDNFFCDQLTEMIPPVSTLGRRFVTVPLATKNGGDIYRVLAAHDGTEVRMDGVLLATLDRGRFHQVLIPSNAYRMIETSQPALVVQYATSSGYDKVVDSDPFMAMVPPVEQFASAYVVSQAAGVGAFYGNGFTNYWANVVAPVESLGGLRLDGAPLPATFTPIGDTGLAGARVTLSAGSHAIRHVSPNVGIGVLAYGFAQHRSFAYVGELRMTPVGSCTPSGQVPGDRIDNDCDERVDEELSNGVDDDGDGFVDEDLAVGPPAFNMPPVAVSDQRVLSEDEQQGLVLLAFDPNGDRLSYDVLAAPAHGTLLRATGATLGTLTNVPAALAYRPQPGYSGTDVMTFRARDAVSASQTATVSFTIRPVNDAPEFTSMAPSSATEEVELVYDAEALDPEGSAVTYAFETSPAAMRLETTTGVVRWTPTNADVGTHVVTLVARDPEGATDRQTFQIRVSNVNDAPVFNSNPVTTAYLGASYEYQARATDPDANETALLRYAVASGPSGLVIDAVSGLVQFRPGSEGTFAVSLQVSDPAGASATQTWNLVVAPDTTKPVCSLVVTPEVVTAGKPVLIQTRASDAGGVATKSLWVDGTPTAIDTQGRASVVAAGIGAHLVELEVEDGAGNVCRASAKYGVPDASDTSPPVVVIGSPEPDGITLMMTTVTGTVTDPNLLKYTVEVQRIGRPGWQVIASGTDPVVGGQLGTIDGTLMVNGLYELKTCATDINGRKTCDTRSIGVDGGAKIGVFSISFTDMTIPVAGIPLTITRTYDSRIKTKEDFGYGWTLGMSAIGSVQHNRKPGDGWRIEKKIGFGYPLCSEVNELKRHITEVRLGERTYFRFKPVIVETTGGLGFCEGKMTFVQTGGTRPGAKLEIIKHEPWVYQQSGASELRNWEDLIVEEVPDVRLTTPEGNIIDLNTTLGVTRFEDRNGNAVSVTKDGLIHNLGLSLPFERDAEGRITKITDPMHYSVQYRYDGNGDLVEFVDQAGNPTHFAYVSQSPHRFESMTNSLGTRSLTNEYDEAGRVLSNTDSMGRAQRFLYNLPESLVAARSRNGQESSLLYDPEGKVLRIVDPLGGQWLLDYDAQGRLRYETDPLGKTSTTTYSTDGRIETFTNVEGDAFRFERDDAGQVVRIQDSVGRDVQMTYDARGNLTERRDADGRSVAFRYDAQGNPTLITPGAGQSTSIVYDRFGRPTRVSLPGREPVRMIYDQLGREIERLTHRRMSNGSAEPLRSARTYDPLGRITSVSGYDGSVVRTSYNALGDVINSEISGQNRQEFRYDSNGQLSEVSIVGVGSFVLERDAADALTSIRSPEGRRWAIERNGVGQVSVFESPGGSRRQFGYDAVGRRNSTTSPRGFRQTETQLEPHVVQVLQANGESIRIAKNGDGPAAREGGGGNPVSVTRGNRHINFEYDLSTDAEGKGQITSVTLNGLSIAKYAFDLDGEVLMSELSGIRTDFYYDPAGRLTMSRTPTGREYRFTQDSMGNLEEITDPEGRRTAFSFLASGKLASFRGPGERRWTYGPSGAMTSAIDGNGMRTDFLYGETGLLEQVAWWNGTVTQLRYDRDGLLVQQGQYDFQRNDAGMLAAVMLNGSTQVQYEYDSDKSMVGFGTPADFVRYVRDQVGRISEIVDEQGTLAEFVTGSDSQTVRVVRRNAVVSEYILGPDGLLTRLIHSGPGGTIADYQVVRDPYGRLVEAVEVVRGDRRYFGYDADGQLVREERLLDGKQPEYLHYEYDGSGNRIRLDSNLLPSTFYSYDLHNELIQQVHGPRTQTLEYDGNGALVGVYEPGNSLALELGPNDRVVSAARPGLDVRFEYDHYNGSVRRRISNGASAAFVVDPSSTVPVILTKMTDAGRASFAYGPAGLLRVRTGTASTFLLNDPFGSPTIMVDDSGAQVGFRSFGAFGELTEKSGNWSQIPIGFRGGVDERELELVRFGGRLYDPRIGRFISRDSVVLPNLSDPRHSNGYLLGGNDPVNRSDPTGKQATVGDIFTAIGSMIYLARVAQLRPIPTGSSLAFAFAPTTRQATRLRDVFFVARTVADTMASGGHYPDSLGRFGPDDASQTDVGVGWRLVRDAASFEKNQLQVDYDASLFAECAPGTLAYVKRTDRATMTPRITFCERYFTDRQFSVGNGSEVSLLLHEITHYALQTVDDVSAHAQSIFVGRSDAFHAARSWQFNAEQSDYYRTGPASALTTASRGLMRPATFEELCATPASCRLLSSNPWELLE